MNCEKKLALLKGEGVAFDQRGMLVDGPDGEGRWWGDFKV
jgi:hypothetical protein